MRAFLFFLGFILLCPVGSQASADEDQAARTVSLSREEKEARVRAVRDALQVARGKEKKGALLNKDVIDGGDCNLAGTIKAAPQIQGAFLSKVSSLTWVTKLNLCNNKLQSLDVDMGCFPCLEDLDLSWNKMNRLPESIGWCGRLKVLKVGFNDLASLPNSLALCTALEDLDLPHNSLTVFPGVLCVLTNLKALNLSGNNNLGIFPRELDHLTSLEELFVNSCGARDLPSSLGQLKQLRVLHAAHNKITSLPQQIGGLTRLEELYIPGNVLPALPVELGELVSLKEVWCWITASKTR